MKTSMNKLWSINNSNEIHQVGNVFPTITRDNPDQGRVYCPDGICGTLTCMEGGNRQPFTIVLTK